MFSFNKKLVDRAEKYRKSKVTLLGKQYSMLDEITVKYDRYSGKYSKTGLVLGIKEYGTGTRYLAILEPEGILHEENLDYLVEVKKHYSVMPEVFEHIDAVEEQMQALKKKEAEFKKAAEEYEASRKRMEALAKKSESFVKEGIIEAHSLIAKSHDS